MANDGRIINLVTTQGAVTAATYSAYAGSKGPVEHFTKAFAKEIGSRGITVNCIAPGPQKTSFLFGGRDRRDPGVARRAEHQWQTRGPRRRGPGRALPGRATPVGSPPRPCSSTASMISPIS